MEPKTRTSLGELRVGDAFLFLNRVSKPEIWRVTALADKRGRVSVNRFNPDTKQALLRHDELKKASVLVVFIRHTVPQHGEECLLDDLQPGDCFKMADGNDPHVYVLVRHGHIFSDVRRRDGLANIKGGKAAKVIFHKIMS